MGFRSHFRSHSRSSSNKHSKSHFTPKSSGKKEHYVYTLNLKGGKKYVGYTSNLDRRMDQHFSGQGSAVTKECKPVSVHSVTKCRSKQKAKNAERIVYHNMKDYHGSDKVRGAGNTKRFSLSQGAGNSSRYYGHANDDDRSVLEEECDSEYDDSEEYASEDGDSVEEDDYASADGFDYYDDGDD